MPRGYPEVYMCVGYMLVCYLGGGCRRMYLLERPEHAEIEARLWRLLIVAEQKMEDYRNRLRFKVEDA